MKNHVLFASIIAVAAILISCNNEPKNPAEQKTPLPDSIMVYNIAADKSETLSQTTYYTYDELGNMICQLNCSIMKKSIDSTKIEMKYNSKGHVTEKMYSAYDLFSNHWRDDQLLIYKYDEKDRLAQYSIYNLELGDTAQSPPIRKCIYSWSDDTHAEVLFYNPGAKDANGEINWRLVYRAEYTLNVHGNVEKGVIYDYHFVTNGELSYMIENTYDQYNNLLLHKTLDDKGVITLQEEYQYEYDDTGKKLVMWYSKSDSDAAPGEPIQKYVYCY